MADLRRSNVLGAVLVSGLLGVPLECAEPTVELLTARHVRSHVRIVPDATAPLVALDGTDVDYSEPLTFLVRGKVKFVIARYNPLTMEAKLESAESEDPSAAALDRFLSAVLTTFKPADARQGDAPSVRFERKHASATDDCEKRSAVEKLLIKFEEAIRGGDLDARQLETWTAGAQGRAGMKTQGAAIASFGRQVAGMADTATEALQDLVELRSALAGELASDAQLDEISKASSVAEQALSVARERLRTASKDTQEAAKTKEKETAQEDVATAETALRAARERGAAVAAADACPRRALALLAVFFSMQPHEQVTRLERLARAASDLGASLEKIANDDDAWFPPPYGPFGDSAANQASKDYVLGARGPKEGKVVTVTITTRRKTLVIQDGVVHQAAVPKSDGKTVFRMRGRALFAPEVGIGLVVASVKTPTYGAVKNDAGATVVAKTKVQERDFKGALMLNAVCRCWSDSFLYPMLQFGVAADKDTPSFFAGAGFRFTRPKGLALSAGSVLAWVKDLDKLQVGSAVASQAAIDADLRSQPTLKPYFALHYSF